MVNYTLNYILNYNILKRSTCHEHKSLTICLQRTLTRHTQHTQHTPRGADYALSTLDALWSLLPGVALLATWAELRPGHSPRSLRAVEACLRCPVYQFPCGARACMRAGGSGAGSTRRAGGAIAARRSSGAAPALLTLGADRSRNACCNSSLEVEDSRVEGCRCLISQRKRETRRQTSQTRRGQGLRAGGQVST